MPGFVAKRLCPNLVIVPTNFEKYSKASDQVRNILYDYDPQLSMHMDEAYMDLTAVVQERSTNLQPVSLPRNQFGGECQCWLPRAPVDCQMDVGSVFHVVVVVKATESLCPKCGLKSLKYTDTVEFGNEVSEVVREMRFRVEQGTGLTCSAGIAPNSMLAKIASDRNKPDGQCLIPNDREQAIEFIRQLPVRKVSGIGGVQEAQLNALDIHTCADIYEKRAIVSAVCSESTTHFLMRVCMGVGHSDGATEDEDTGDSNGRKSVSVERTFADESDPTTLTEICANLCQKLAEDLMEKNYKGLTVTIKLKTSAFDTFTRARSVKQPVHTADQLMTIAHKLLNIEIEKKPGLSLRLLGVRLSNLHSPGNESQQHRTLSQYFTGGPNTSVDDEDSRTGTWSDCEVVHSDLNVPAISASTRCMPPPTTFSSTDTSIDTTDIAILDGEHDKLDDTINGGQSCNTISENTESGTLIDQLTPSSSDTSNLELFICPVCTHRLPHIGSEHERTHHVEECLSRQSIADILKEQNQSAYGSDGTLVAQNREQKVNLKMQKSSSTQRSSSTGLKRKATPSKSNVDAVKSRKLDCFLKKD